ncbi:MAG: ATP-binding protein [Gammaproteobacteria bacterium]
MSNGAKPSVDAARLNATSLELELSWLKQVIEVRLGLHFENELDVAGIDDIDVPDHEPLNSQYAQLIAELALSVDARLVLILALAPHVKPNSLDMFTLRNKNFDRGFSEFGGVLGKTHGGFLPTLETALFLLAGEDIVRRVALLHLFEDDHVLMARNVLNPGIVDRGEPAMSRRLSPTAAAVSRLTTGVTQKPDFSLTFPAKLTTSPLTWDDLVLPKLVKRQIRHVTQWVLQSDKILHEWDMGRNIKAGYRCLFYGPPGTGKTLAATVIGQEIGADVYRIDLSMLVSKYIGETEKNLAEVFDQAQSRNWVLFFDEADSLFGKRSQTTSSNDRHSNREVSYLLQRVEAFPGLVILATNMQANIDEAFARRFQTAIYFPMPGIAERRVLWDAIIGDKVECEADVNLDDLAADYELSGGAIINVVRYAAVEAAGSKTRPDVLTRTDLTEGARRELSKEGRTA